MSLESFFLLHTFDVSRRLYEFMQAHERRVIVRERSGGCYRLWHDVERSESW